ncbi:unnamed protein product [Soboliphyme baturini]|uniref:G_PROTEIN_RECEP_F1_2 domain-containing protein n=1 Tax=Soboliphyme baturini TaxID=241478 RepID=A0A183IDR5_9BILA|nr:unnamed protein product [Soboliphyme baturini]
MLHKHKHGYNEAMAYVMFLLPGIIAYCSTINEANTLFLICERYVSVCHPLFWNTVSMESKYRMFLGSFLSSFVVTTVRLTYFGTVRIERLPYNLTTDDLYHVVHRERLDSAAFEVWMNFNDIFIPTMFLVVMLYATVSMCLVIRRRNQVKVQPNSTTLTSGHCGSESRSTTESRKATHLMLATAITFSMSQITWLSLKVSHMVDFDKSPITLSSTRAEIQIWFKLYILHNVSSIACTIFESAYHAVNFYSYILFNRRFRIELKQKLKKLLRI